ncbi:ras-related protein Rap1-like [Saccostrea echinata]|uniref:ras-related protein Rap1-like n=1 Tax=Saccostrea echinata TaxID=191078 RepID=UPI002A7EE954|nr:ras-related protein Rap1-like [Saccostrea echinata]
MKQLRIVFLGAEQVGKTSTIKQFLYGSFQEMTEATLGECYNETVCLPNGICQQIQIIDTAGSDEFPGMTDLNIRNGDYFVVVYAIEDRNTLDHALTLCQKIRHIKGKDFNRIVLVGNKIDLNSSRQVTTEEVLQKSIADKNFWFTETSAKLNCNIRCLFQIILRNYVKSDDLFRRNENTKVTKSKNMNTKVIRSKSRKTSIQNLVYSLQAKGEWKRIV